MHGHERPATTAAAAAQNCFMAPSQGCRIFGKHIILAITGKREGRMRRRRPPRNHAVALVMMAVVSTVTFIGSGGPCLAQGAAGEPRRFELRIEDGRIAGNLKAL